MPTSVVLHLDVLIIGGGIAGLWTLDELRRRGHACALIERDALGAGQTVWSQGIIHGGLKYTLSGAMNPSAETIREMPGVWRECLGGRREPDLSGAPVRAPNCHLWQTASLASRVGMIGARVGLRVAPVILNEAERPVVLRACPGIVARLDEQVVDPAAVLRVLARRNAGSVWRAELADARRDGDGISVSLGQSAVRTRRLVLAAGLGNAALRESLALEPGRTQSRPLRMTLVRSPGLAELNGHCVDGARTRVTITTARDAAGRNVWQVGGESAERGVSLSSAEAMRFARSELLATLPGLDLSGAEFAAYDAPRAEPANGGRRPDDAAIIEEGPVLTVFPTKLALAPRLARLLADRLGPARPQPTIVKPGGFAAPVVAPPPWETARWDRID